MAQHSGKDKGVSIRGRCAIDEEENARSNEKVHDQHQEDE